MRELNIDFQEKYKEVDRFIRDAWQSEQGVSEYIRQMEESLNVKVGTIYVAGYNKDFAMLKECRNIRNKLVHEVSIDSDICSQQNYDDLCNFYDRLMAATDPIAQLEKLPDKLDNVPPVGADMPQFQKTQLQKKSVFSNMGSKIKLTAAKASDQIKIKTSKLHKKEDQPAVSEVAEEPKKPEIKSYTDDIEDMYARIDTQAPDFSEYDPPKVDNLKITMGMIIGTSVLLILWKIIEMFI